MRPTQEVIREEISALIHLQAVGADSQTVKARSLNLIDHVARWATDVHREIPNNVLVHLTAAMRAAGREDVAGVMMAVEAATALIGNRKGK